MNGTFELKDASAGQFMFNLKGGNGEDYGGDGNGVHDKSARMRLAACCPHACLDHVLKLVLSEP